MHITKRISHCELNFPFYGWQSGPQISTCPQDAIAIVTGTMDGVYARKPRSNSLCLYQTTLKSVQLQRKPWTIPKVLFTLQGLQWQMCHQHSGCPQSLQVHDFGVNLSRSCLISYDVYTHTYIICLFKSKYIYILYVKLCIHEIPKKKRTRNFMLQMLSSGPTPWSSYTPRTTAVKNVDSWGHFWKQAASLLQWWLAASISMRGSYMLL